MARPIWRGTITFGLVNVPVNLVAAERRNELSFHMIDRRNMARVRYERINAETGEEVPWDQIVKGYEYTGGNYVILGDEDLKRAAPEATQQVEIESFVDPAEIDLMYFDKPYFLEPGKGGTKGYVLLREVLRETGRVGIARVVIRTRQYIAALAPEGDALVLELLRYREELRAADDLNLPRGDPKEHKVAPQELKVAKALVESMAAKWKPERYHDEYRDALMKWIEKRVASGDLEHPAEPLPHEEPPPAPINFMELLKKSVAQQGGARTGAAPRSRTTRKAAHKAGKKAGGTKKKAG